MLLRTQIMVCGGTGCLSSKSNLIKDEFISELKRLGIGDEVQVIQTGCFGLCEKGPVVIVYPDEIFYSKVTISDVKPICEEHILKGKIYLPKAYKELTEEEENYKRVGNMEEANNIGKQKSLLEKYLPQLLTDSEIKNIIASLEDKTVPSVMRHFKMNYNGKCDMKLVSTVLKEFN